MEFATQKHLSFQYGQQSLRSLFSTEVINPRRAFSCTDLAAHTPHNIQQLDHSKKHNAFGLRQTRHHIYLDQLHSLDFPETAPKPGEIRLKAITHNLLHPGIALFDKNPKNRNNARFGTLALAYQDLDADVLLTQESTAPATAAFTQAGFKAIEADKLTPAPAPLQTRATGYATDMRTQWRFKSDWKGLTSYYNPKTCSAAKHLRPEFLPYPESAQKGWWQVLSAALALLQACLFLSRTASLRAYAQGFICSLSGIAREDGLLVAYLEDNNGHKPLILCNTHLESFDHNIRLAQLKHLFKQLEYLRQTHPEAIIVVGGDFNYPQLSKVHQSHYCLGLKDQLYTRFGARTLPREAIVATIKEGGAGADIDGLYVLPPKNTPIKHLSGKTIFPLPEGQDYQLSDHCAVALKLEFKAPPPESTA